MWGSLRLAPIIFLASPYLHVQSTCPSGQIQSCACDRVFQPPELAPLERSHTSLNLENLKIRCLTIGISLEYLVLTVCEEAKVSIVHNGVVRFVKSIEGAFTGTNIRRFTNINT